jgi:uncharacterized protein (TIGR03083 family)
MAIVVGLSTEEFQRCVPACPLWSVRDLVAHLVGVAEDSTRGQFFGGAVGAWADAELAARREVWTAGQVEARRGHDPDELVADLQRHGTSLVRALRRGDPSATDVPAWMIGAPVDDLAVHLDDLREALGLPPVPEAVVAEYGFRAYRAWLGNRIAARGLAPLRLTDGDSVWLLGGDGEPTSALRADSHELFRAISGRRPLEVVRSWSWTGDPSPYLSVLSPYSSS